MLTLLNINLKNLTMNLRTRRVILLVLAFCLVVTTIISLISHYGNKPLTCPLYEYIGLGLSVLLLIFLSYDIDFRICFKRTDTKKECPFMSKNDCPYSTVLDCPYNTSHCKSFPERNKRNIRTYMLWILLVASLTLYIVSVIVIKQGPFYDIATPICLSIISAIAVAFLIDLPGKMREYQGYFVDLLSSNDYLKQLDDEALSKLRKQITWVQHAKDYPNMPRELIELDERLCNMLREPYFEEFTQIITLTKVNDKIIKHCSVEYTIKNPGRDGRKVSVDIGLSNAVIFSDINNEELLKSEAAKTLKINKFVAYFDNNENAYNLEPHSRILVYTDVPDNTDYNGEIHIAPLNEYSNKSNPLSIKNLSSTPSEQSVVEVAKTNKIDFCIEFEQKVVIKFEYEIMVPEKDKCFSKRLRYPVKYFKLDYILGEGFDNVKLSGQLIGTLIDQQNISFYQSKDKKQLSFWTHSWLLPQNGVFIVHSEGHNE